jgi:type IV pilus assembly protein PilW
MSTPRVIAEGIENMQIEYGIDNNDDGTPDTFSSATLAADDWKKTVAAKVFLLARNTEPTAGYTDAKQYSLDSAGTLMPAFNDHYKRHAYTSTIMATNIAGRKLP